MKLIIFAHSIIHNNVSILTAFGLSLDLTVSHAQVLAAVRAVVVHVHAVFVTERH